MSPELSHLSLLTALRQVTVCCYLLYQQSHGGHNHSHHHGHGHVHEHKRSHRHAHGHGVQAEDFLEENDPVLKGLVALGGIYVLFIIEHCIRMYKHYNKQKVRARAVCYCKLCCLKCSPSCEELVVCARRLSDMYLCAAADSASRTELLSAKLCTPPACPKLAVPF